jgi:hypothetical protein
MSNNGLMMACGLNSKFEKPIIIKTLSENLNLSNSEINKFIFVTNHNNYSIVLPSAISLKLKDSLIIKNATSSTLSIRDNSGNNFINLTAGQKVKFSCIGNSSFAGSWSSLFLGT